MTRTNQVHDTPRRAFAQAWGLPGWIWQRPWAALALLLGAGMLCGAGVRGGGGWVQSMQAAAVTAAGVHSPPQRRVQACGQGQTSAASRALARLPNERCVQPAGGAGGARDWQEGVVRDPRTLFGHNAALARHGPVAA